MRGKDKGKSIKLHQYCNDWATSEEGKVYNITSLEFSPEEIEQIKRSDKLHQCGVMFMAFEWKDNRIVRRQ